MKIKTILPILIFCVFFTSCQGGSYSMLSGSIKTKSNSIQAKYSKLNGFYYKTITLNSGDQIVFEINEDTKDGEIMYYLQSIETKEKWPIDNMSTITVEEDAKYRVRIEADKHKGSFYINWSID